jgi:hypothetical protein
VLRFTNTATYNVRKFGFNNKDYLKKLVELFHYWKIIFPIIPPGEPAGAPALPDTKRA